MKRFFSQIPWKQVFPWLAVAILALAALFLNFCMVGYSFSVLVCCVLMGIIVFYTVSAGLKKKLPRTMKWLRRSFTVILCMGILVVGITEGFVIGASFPVRKMLKYTATVRIVIPVTARRRTDFINLISLLLFEAENIIHP